ncbi:hypothetical protein KOR42_12040 [Thalassoglobus neptunius]|uniref:Glycosyltransferase RgtA/B/C/D-like domain-containing protein n=1 Tax=Thalassoglobus neptunius TaxID=1938619 RepID=A0A5C5X3Y9_9PLAN|nr:glycosyltransferase family 39 protein [Thalassoglobus neptunius]TWT57837.1 hypothetical protein KOR42_12040 [Thalassoglobus neptunius]
MRKPVELIANQDAAVTAVWPTDRQAALFFWLFLIGHCLAWIVVPSLTQPNGTLDAIEMIYWGHEWELGYYKHPPLPAWLAESASWLGGNTVWPTFVLAQISTAACFWAVFMIGRDIGGNRFALLAVLLLESCYYYNFTTTEFNNNVTSRGFCAAAVALVYFAMTRERLHYWALSGVAIGCGMLSKYDTALFAIIMLAFSIVHPRGREAWKTAGPFVLLATSGLCFAPHLYWLVQNDFPTIDYLLRRSDDGETTLISHVLEPLEFLLSQIWAIAPLLILSIPVTGLWWKKRTNLSEKASFQRDFVLWFGLGPVLLVMAVTMLTGGDVRSMWGAKIWTFTGLALLSSVQIQGSLVEFQKVCRRCVLAGGIAIIALLGRNLVVPHFRDHGSRVHFPGKALATVARDAYEAEVGEAPKVIGGPWWDAANVAVLGDQRATVFANLDPSISPWASDQFLKENGGVIVWQPKLIRGSYAAEVRERFPKAIFIDPVELDWETPAKLEPILFQIAIVKPEPASQKVVKVSDASGGGNVVVR